jgi:hypothetical protein
MRKTTISLVLLAAVFAVPFKATAAPLVTSSTRTDTRVFVGLQWNFGNSRPEIMLGAQHTETDSDNSVVGGKFDVALPFDLQNLKPTVRLLALAGNRDLQGELGLGIQTSDWKPLIAVGAQLPFVDFGANYVFDEAFKPYIGLNSLKKPEPAHKRRPIG